MERCSGRHGLGGNSRKGFHPVTALIACKIHGESQRAKISVMEEVSFAHLVKGNGRKNWRILNSPAEKFGFCITTDRVIQNPN
jgi:hypothetical protein